ncbi:MAG: DUF1015 domain-containing protein [Actinomycetota bacterium]|nr:DUF1015 domain-containing protein [Actinomycetota bacterium]
MAEIIPFRGVRYDDDSGDLASLSSPPYDVVSPAHREELEQRSPFNVIRLILPRDEPDDHENRNKYTRAAELLSTWASGGILREDSSPSLYLYEQRYMLAGNERIMRGLVAAVSLDESSVLPHERTMAGPVGDRLDLMRTTEANLEPILCVYAGEDGPARDAVIATLENDPLTSFEVDRVRNSLWMIDDFERIRTIQSALASAQLVIADGHHRYRTAQQYREERRAAGGPGPWDAMMMLVVDTDWCGPSLLAIHRLVSGIDAAEAREKLSGAFEIEDAMTRDPASLGAELARRRESGRVFAMVSKETACWLTLADKETAAEAMPSDRSPTWRDLDVAVLHSLVFERALGVEAAFVHSIGEAIEALDRGEATLAFLLAPTPFEAVRKIAEEGESMPPKSTYFFPKPRTGVVMRSLR